MTVAKWDQPTLGAEYGPHGGLGVVTSRDVVDGWAHQVAAVAKLATYIAATDFVPRGYRGQDAAVAAAILAGREMGIGPMTALQHLYVVDGRPAMSAQLMRALVFAHGHTIRVAEASSERCTLVGRRAGDTAETTMTWTMADARRAQVGTKPNWARYPRAMLLARTTAELCRAIFPDVIGGMSYTVEEVEDMPAEAPETLATRTVRRGRAPKAVTPPDAPSEAAVTTETPRPSSSTPSPTGGEPPPLPDAPTRPGNADFPPSQPEQAPTPQRAPTDGTKPLSGPQRAQLFRLLGELGRLEPRAERIRTVSGLTHRRLDSLNDLTRADATALIDTLVRITEHPDTLDPLVTAGWEHLNAQGTPDPDDPDDPETLWEPPNDTETGNDTDG